MCVIEVIGHRSGWPVEVLEEYYLIVGPLAVLVAGIVSRILLRRRVGLGEVGYGGVGVPRNLNQPSEPSYRDTP